MTPEADVGNEKPGIILGVDLGDARTGLALYGRAGSLVVGLETVRGKSFKETVAAVAGIARREGAELIVVGDPLNMNGTRGPRSEKCRAFAAELAEASGVPTELFDGRLTTVVATGILAETGVRGKKRRNTVDEVAATLILEDWVKKNLGK